MLTSEQKLLCTFSHLAVFTGLAVIIPLVIFLLSKDKFVKDQAKEAMIFQIALVIGFTLSVLFMLVLVGFLMIAVLIVVLVVFPILATVANINNKFYEYPITTELARKI